MIMNKTLNILFFIGLLLFLFVALNSFGGGSNGPLIIFDPYEGQRIYIPYYDFITITTAVISIMFLLLVLIFKFKNLPDLRQNFFSYNLLVDDNNPKKFDVITVPIYLPYTNEIFVDI